MSTLSVPLSSRLLRAIENLVKQGIVSSKAEAARKALEKYIEDIAVQEVLEASKEPRLKGNLKELMKKLK